MNIMTRRGLLFCFVHLHMYSYVRKYERGLVPIHLRYILRRGANKVINTHSSKRHVIQFHEGQGEQSSLFGNKKRNRWVHTSKNVLSPFLLPHNGPLVLLPHTLARARARVCVCVCAFVIVRIGALWMS